MRETKAAATLTAALLAPKGEARPAGWRVASRAPEGRPWYADLHEGGTAARPAPKPAEALEPASQRPSAAEAAPLAPAASLARIGAGSTTAALPGRPAAGDRVRITARLERDLHRRLKLASAHLETSSQDLIADALSHYLDGVAAGPMRGHCACLGEGGRRETEGCGSCGPETAR